MKTHWNWFFQSGITHLSVLSTAVLQIVIFFNNSTLAQELKPVADNSLGTESSAVATINPLFDKIDGGAIRGTNLFHSFSQFHVGEGRAVYFANPSGIENILSRVTGTEVSKIFGKLGVLGNANLFLINPNGIIFGRNASLDVKGSLDLASHLLPTNDITAISQQNPSLSGQISITTPDVDPSRGLVELPVNLVDTSQQIATRCTPRHGQTSSFIVTGRGGLPLSPTNLLRSQAIVTQWITLDEQTGNQTDGKAKPVELSEHPARNQEPIVEANGWVVDKEGDVYLVAQAPNAKPSFQTTTAFCRTAS